MQMAQRTSQQGASWRGVPPRPPTLPAMGLDGMSRQQPRREVGSTFRLREKRPGVGVVRIQGIQVSVNVWGLWE